MWLFAGWPRQATGAVKLVSPFVGVLAARAMWREEQNPCGVDPFGEGAKVGSGGNGPERDCHKEGEAVREVRSGFAWGSTFFSQSVRSHGVQIPPRDNVLESSSRSLWKFDPAALPMLLEWIPPSFIGDQIN